MYVKDKGTNKLKQVIFIVAPCIL